MSTKTAKRPAPSGPLMTTKPPAPSGPPVLSRPKLNFYCQQAQGSPTGIISGFTSIKELYEKIAACYDFPPEDILFCTLNTHRVDMNSLLGGQIGLEDYIFAHRKGQRKEIEITKTEDALGLTITDNGAGYCFIKKIREGSIIDQNGNISVGDHIERIDNENLVNKKHVEVAKYLKDIPKGTNFTIRLVEPLKSGFGPIEGGRKNAVNGINKSIGPGNKTVRIDNKGQARIEMAPSDVIEKAIEKIDGLLEGFMGVNDTALATQIWKLGQDTSNPIELTETIGSSELSEFHFNEDFIFDAWGIISDVKAGRRL